MQRISKYTLQQSHTKLQNRIGSPLTDTGVDKTKMLVEAQKAGLSIPKTLITSKKEELLKFQQKNQQLITKGIQGVAFFSFQDTQLGNYTEVVTEETIAVAPLTFFPSLFQELLDKDYELRIFYIHKELYAMAIFSQLDSQTMVDFRKYNNTKPNRNVPYKLPEAIANKIINFMEAMQLNSGSLDMVVTKTGEYVFLEVNPVGQFGMVSAPCNYFIEKRIAQLLTQ
jgi:ATP-GRASP peptide maturase of grasp-with-spasm system